MNFSVDQLESVKKWARNEITIDELKPELITIVPNKMQLKFASELIKNSIAKGLLNAAELHLLQTPPKDLNTEDRKKRTGYQNKVNSKFAQVATKLFESDAPVPPPSINNDVTVIDEFCIEFQGHVYTRMPDEPRVVDALGEVPPLETANGTLIGDHIDFDAFVVNNPIALTADVAEPVEPADTRIIEVNSPRAEGMECSIGCGEDMPGTGTVLCFNCNNPFHLTCIMHWINARKLLANCPMCRSPLGEEFIRQAIDIHFDRTGERISLAGRPAYGRLAAGGRNSNI